MTFAIHASLKALATPLNKLEEDPQNARSHDSKSIESIMESLKQYGQRKPIVVRQFGDKLRIIAGNGTFRAAERLKAKEIACVITTDDEITAKGYALVDNRTAELSGWDIENLGLQLGELKLSDFNFDAFGFDFASIAELGVVLPELETAHVSEHERSLPTKTDSESDDEAEDEPMDVAIPTSPEPRVKMGDIWQLGRHTLVCGSSLDQSLVHSVIGEHEAHAIVTDPPYGLGTIEDLHGLLSDWMKGGDGDAFVGKAGFMGKAWDRCVPPPSLWKTWFSRARPGAHALVFSGTRTQDLMTLGLRIAGFECRDQLAWCFGSGFPKSLDISKQLDKELGAEREVIGQPPNWRPAKTKGGAGFDKDVGNGSVEMNITAPATDAAKQWQGFGTNLKPALEPISLVRIPLSEDTVAKNVLKWGTGGINIDGCRIDHGGNIEKHNTPSKGGLGKNGIYGDSSREQAANSETRYHSTGRFPSNLLLDPEAAALLDEQSGVSKSTGGRSVKRSGTYVDGKVSAIGEWTNEDPGFGDVGGASRFFYVAKSSKSERNLGMNSEETDGEESTNSNPITNTHSTVKPLRLMQYLVRLVTPPGGTVLEPFCGSGTTLLACELEGVVCKSFEFEPKHCDIILARFEGMTGQKAELLRSV